MISLPLLTNSCYKQWKSSFPSGVLMGLTSMGLAYCLAIWYKRNYLRFILSVLRFPPSVQEWHQLHSLDHHYYTVILSVYLDCTTVEQCVLQKFQQQASRYERPRSSLAKIHGRDRCRLWLQQAMSAIQPRKTFNVYTVFTGST